MLDKKVADLINTQVIKDSILLICILILPTSMQNRASTVLLIGIRYKAQKSADHAMLFVKYLQNNDAKVTYEAIDKPNIELKNNMDPLQAGLKHEQYVTSLINNIYDAAYAVKDFRSMQFLDWFVKEQGEEETNATDMIKKMEISVLILKDSTCSIRNWLAALIALLPWFCKFTTQTTKRLPSSWKAVFYSQHNSLLFTVSANNKRAKEPLLDNDNNR